MPVVRAERAEPCWVDLFTSDLDGAIEFYSRLFGWENQSVGHSRPDHYQQAQLDGQPVCGLVANDAEGSVPDAWMTYLRVADVHSAMFATKLHGGQRYLKPVVMPGQGTMALIGDPAGAGVGLWQGFAPQDSEKSRGHGHRIWNELHTKHFEIVARFYREALGWELSPVADSAEFRYSTLGQGAQAAAGLYDVAGHDTTEGWRTYFAVNNTDESAALAQELGGSVINEPHDSFFGRTAMLADPGGAEFAVIAPVKN
ncbi:VOC family protein [Arthrobacter sp. NIO-1057]|uniref:VOC family protein n=1 Tax=Arthrobacter sp. NIO-1057 TaxID=993071 RepID=UPI00071DAF04|nr:VOC family protein [Arthrobacter sp. NIO-1057]KSU65866.1 hypothetical protein AS038_09165 [Arthrobacter sp. NIO-1057]SCC26055.1 hypothetical protein GA0061084_1863 [Arthrobacter sp. NIO-1057]